MPLFPSNQQAANQILVRVPVPAQVQSNKQQQPIQESQEAAEEQKPVKDTGFERVNDDNPHSIIIPYFEEARQYQTMRAPKRGLINRGLFIRGGQFTPNVPDKIPNNIPLPTEVVKEEKTTKLDINSDLIKHFKRILKKHKK